MTKYEKGIIIILMFLTISSIIKSYYLEKQFTLGQEQYEILIENITHFETLLDLYEKNYEEIKNQINIRLGGHPRHFITPDDPLLNQKVLEITGGWSDTSDMREFWIDVDQIFFWVKWNIKDNQDIIYPRLPSSLGENIGYEREVWLYPYETLSLKLGDCEDKATLLCSMIIIYENQNPIFQVECIHIRGFDPRAQDLYTGHIAVQISIKDELAILDPTTGYTTYDYTESHMVNVSKEIYKYIGTFPEDLVLEPQVYRVFSNNLLLHYNSTDEYIQWMKTR